MAQQKWNAEIVISAIRNLHEKGKKINLSHVQKNNSKLYQAACRHLGSWKAAVEAAGLTHALPKRNRWSKEIIVQKIIKLHREEEPLYNAHIKEVYPILYTVSCQYFGSWKAAVEAAGFDYSTIIRRKMRNWSKKAVVEEIKRRKSSGLSIAGGTVSIEDYGLYEAAARYFGKHGWAKAREAAGFDPKDPKPGIIYDKEVVIKELQRLHAAGYEINSKSLIKSPHVGTLTAATRLFGTYDKALKAAGFDPKKIRKVQKWTREKVLREIQKLEKAGVRLSWWATQKTHSALCATANRLFGSWGAAVEAAGINYREHMLTWSTKTWLRSLETEEYEKIVNPKTNED